MSKENVEIVRDGYAQRAITRRFDAESAGPDFVWDMSNFRGWPEQQTYEGVEGANAFLSEWIGAWDHWPAPAGAPNPSRSVHLAAPTRARNRFAKQV
jgi:hypothetical protein